MSNPVHLSLLMGPVVPLAVPRLMIDALESVTVTSAAGSASGFQMRFKINSRSELNTIFLVAAGNNAGIATPPLRVLLVVTLNGAAEPLFDGVVTNVEVQAGQQGQAGSITVTGEDLTKVMDMIDFSGLPYPAMPIEARVALICAKYAAFGVLPLPVPTLFPDVPIPVERIPAHQGTDLAADPFVFFHVRRNHHRVRASLQRLEHRHGGMNAVNASDIAGRGDDAAPPAADDDWAIGEGGIVALLDRGVEGVAVEMGDGEAIEFGMGDEPGAAAMRTARRLCLCRREAIEAKRLVVGGGRLVGHGFGPGSTAA